MVQVLLLWLVLTCGSALFLVVFLAVDEWQVRRQQTGTGATAPGEPAAPEAPAVNAVHAV